MVSTIKDRTAEPRDNLTSNCEIGAAEEFLIIESDNPAEASPKPIEPNDPNPEQLIPVLSFDGGGVRTYASLLILKALMDEINAIGSEPGKRTSDEQGSQLRPRDVFSFIFGSSSGGLIAIMLGRLGMTVDDCLEKFRAFLDVVFRRGIISRTRFRLVLGGGKYSNTKLYAAVKQVVGQYESSPPGERFAQPDDIRRTGVLANEVGSARPYLFRTYNAPSGSKPRGTISNSSSKADINDIWQIALATSASPLYFLPVEIEGKRYSDASVGFNNPSLCAYLEVLDASRPSDRVAIISIGSGRAQDRPRDIDSGGFSVFRKGRELSVTKSETVLQLLKDKVVKRLDYYFRFDPELDRPVAYDEWEVKTISGKKRYVTAERLESLTEQYLNQKMVVVLLHECARIITRHRQTSRI